MQNRAQISRVNSGLENLIDRWTVHLRDERRYSPHTVSGYLRDFGQCMTWTAAQLGRAPALPDLDLERLQGWLAQLPDQAATVQRKGQAVRSFLRYVVERAKLLPSNPADGLILPRIPQRLPKALTEQQCRDLLQAPLAGLDPAKAAPAWRVRDAAVIAVLYGGGLRCCEVERLDLADVRWDAPEKGDVTLRVLGKRNKEGLVVCPPHVARALRAYLARRQELCGPLSGSALFVSLMDGAPRLGRVGVSRCVVRWSERLGFHASGHQLRHSCATHMLDHGAELRAVQDFLRHEDPRTTANYARVTLLQQKKRATKYHPMSRPQPPDVQAFLRRLFAAGRPLDPAPAPV